MAAKRYWRLNISATESGTNAEVAELELIDLYGNVQTWVKNVGTPGASGDDGSNPATNAFDNDVATAWRSDASLPATLDFDFGAGNGQIIARYAVRADDADNTDAPTAWTLEYSDNGASWTEADSRTGQSFTAGERKEFTIYTHKVSGVVQIDAAPASRILRAYAEDSGELLGQDVSDAGDGTYEIQFPEPPGRNILVLCFDDYGVPWESSLAVSADELVTPTSANGRYYKAQGAGTTGGSEPIWPTTLGQTVNDNGITWEDMGPLQAPLIQGPFIPQPV